MSETLDMFGSLPDVKAPPKRKRKKPALKVKKPENQDLLKVLFPEDYSQEEHLQALMETDWFPWCEQDVRLLQQKVARDAFDILCRTNSSKSAVSESLIWVFNDQPDYDFSISQVAALCKISTAHLQRMYVRALTQTLKRLQKKESNSEKIEFYHQCVVKAKSLLIEEEFVELNSVEASCL